MSVLAHCREELPLEACGLLLGRGDAVLETWPARNVASGDRRRRFELDPREFIAADADARIRGLEILGVYHSHPDRTAQPSEADREAAQAGWSQLIVGRPDAPDAELRSWRLVDGSLTEEPLRSR